jgi:hypothetical protein
VRENLLLGIDPTEIHEHKNFVKKEKTNMDM